MQMNNSIVLLVFSLFVHCTAFISADTSLITTELSEATAQHVPVDSNQEPRLLRANEKVILEDQGSPDAEERGTSNVDSVLKKSASLKNLKAFRNGESELNKVKAVLKKAPSLGKFRALSMKEAEINKVKNIVARNPELQRAKSLVTNPQKLTKDELKLVAKFAKDHPKEGSTLFQWIFLISGLAVVLGVGTIVVASAANGGKK